MVVLVWKDVVHDRSPGNQNGLGKTLHRLVVWVEERRLKC